MTSLATRPFFVDFSGPLPLQPFKARNRDSGGPNRSRRHNGTRHAVGERSGQPYGAVCGVHPGLATEWHQLPPERRRTQAPIVAGTTDKLTARLSKGFAGGIAPDAELVGDLPNAQAIAMSPTGGREVIHRTHPSSLKPAG